MKRKQKIALGVAITAISALSVLGTGIATANASGETLSACVASRFNLNQTDVDKVFSEFRIEERGERSADRSADLQTKVDNGTITAEQKALIVSKIAEIEAERDANRNQGKTREEMREEMHTSRDELRTWAKANGIDESLIMPMGGRGGGHGVGGMGMGRHKS
jgi:hypothetical protein